MTPLSGLVEAEGPPDLFLDLTEDAVIPHEEGRFLEGLLTEAEDEAHQAGSSQVFLGGDRWCWDLRQATGSARPLRSVEVARSYMRQAEAGLEDATGMAVEIYNLYERLVAAQGRFIVFLGGLFLAASQGQDRFKSQLDAYPPHQL